MIVRNQAALACFAAAAGWPVATGWAAAALMSPLERAMRDGWCGVPYHAASEVLGHCVACWTISAILAAAGLFLIVAPNPSKAVLAQTPSTVSRWPPQF